VHVRPGTRSRACNAYPPLVLSSDPRSRTEFQLSQPVKRVSRFVPRGWASTLEVRRFAAVGVLSTLVDYLLFVALTKIMQLPLAWVWVAKLLSGTVAISISFYLNRKWVFRATGAAKVQAVRFATTTIVGVFGIQTALTQSFTTFYPGLGRALYVVLKDTGLPADFPSVVTEPLAIKTTAFALATAVSMTFNFLLYRHWVFRAKTQTST